MKLLNFFLLFAGKCDENAYLLMVRNIFSVVSFYANLYKNINEPHSNFDCTVLVNLQ